MDCIFCGGEMQTIGTYDKGKYLRTIFECVNCGWRKVIRKRKSSLS
ncbi:MAG: hypothetical protein ACFFAO_12480 [Candidatus Hermodarchaeota archaeon]